MRSVPVLTCIAASVLALILGWVSYLAFERADTRMQHSQLEAIGRQFRSSLNGAGRMVQAQADMISGLPAVKRGLADLDGDGIVARLSSSFETLRSQFDLDVFQAIQPNNRVLARVQDPKRVGDDLSKTRQMVAQANVTRKPQDGFDIGAGGLRVRAVIPVNSDGRHVGLFEVGQKVNRLLENLARASGAEVALLINEDAERFVQREAGKQPVRLGDLTIDVSTNDVLFADIAKQLHFAQVKEPSFGRVTTADHTYAVMQLSFSNFSNQPMGNFVVLKEVDDNTKGRRAVLLQIMSIAAIGALAMSCLILVVFRGLLLAPVSAAATQIEAIADGKTPEPLPARHGDDSISRLFRAIERWRTKRAKSDSEPTL